MGPGRLRRRLCALALFVMVQGRVGAQTNFWQQTGGRFGGDVQAIFATMPDYRSSGPTGAKCTSRLMTE